MSQNKIKEPVIAETPAVEAPPKKKSSSNSKRNFIRFMKVFGSFNRNQIADSMPFILFVTLLIICYIANSYYAEGIIREIDKTKNDLKEKRAEYISTKSRLMYQSNQSQVAKSLRLYDVKESTEPPTRIFVEGTTTENK
jgi:hypothetical protein